MCLILKQIAQIIGEESTFKNAKHCSNNLELGIASGRPRSTSHVPASLRTFLTPCSTISCCSDGAQSLAHTLHISPTCLAINKSDLFHPISDPHTLYTGMPSS